MKRFWISWYSDIDGSGFELHSPWWRSGYAEDRTIFCAAIMAEDDEAAMRVIEAAHDNLKVPLHWRFVEEKASDWSPFNSRFQQADWMRWPT